MNIFTKKVEPRFTGDIEMTEIPSPKRLGNKTRKNISPVKSSPKSKNTPIINISPVKSSPKSISTLSSVPSVISVKSKKKKAKEIYTKRSKYSKCRGLAKPKCLTKKLCMFTNGELRKYCRKRYNRRINL